VLAAAYTLIYWRKGKEKCKVALGEMEPRESFQTNSRLPPYSQAAPRRTPQQKDTAPRSAFLQFVCYSSNLKQLHSCAAPRSTRPC
jgi:hypothetical protein